MSANGGTVILFKSSHLLILLAGSAFFSATFLLLTVLFSQRFGLNPQDFLQGVMENLQPFIYSALNLLGSTVAFILVISHLKKIGSAVARILIFLLILDVLGLIDWGTMKGQITIHTIILLPIHILAVISFLTVRNKKTTGTSSAA